MNPYRPRPSRVPVKQQQQAQCYPPGAAPEAASFGAQPGAAAHDNDFGSMGGKASRRKERDMERALARGDLGALGNQVRRRKTRAPVDARRPFYCFDIAAPTLFLDPSPIYSKM